MDLKYWIRHFKRKYQKRFVIPEYSYKRLQILEYSQKYNSKLFVETGTFFGDTTDFLKEHFERLYTIELQIDLYNSAIERFKNNNKIEVIYGDSSIVLKNLSNKLDRNTIFWLDGHYSSEFYVGNKYIKTAIGDKDTPILEELTEILKNGLKRNVILIDDALCFIGENDYPTKGIVLFFQKIWNKKKHIF